MLKKIVLLLTVCFMVAVPVFASEAPNVTTVQVSGNSQKEVAPDIAKISISINSINPNIEQAKSENTTAANQVFAKLKELGIADGQIKTSTYQIDSVYNYEKDRLPKLKGYQVTNTLEITTSIEKVGMLVNEVTGAGATEVNSIHFEKSNESEMKDEALGDAVADALKKAEVIASALHKRVVNIKVVNESGVFYRPVMMESRAFKNMSADAGAAPAIAPGKVTVGANVQVTVELQ